MTDSITLHSLDPSAKKKKWAFGDWSLSRVGYDGNEFAALYGQVRTPFDSENPVDHYLMIPGRPPFYWQSPLFDDSRATVETILSSCLASAVPA